MTNGQTALLIKLQSKFDPQLIGRGVSGLKEVARDLYDCS